MRRRRPLAEVTSPVIPLTRRPDAITSTAVLSLPRRQQSPILSFRRLCFFSIVTGSRGSAASLFLVSVQFAPIGFDCFDMSFNGDTSVAKRPRTELDNSQQRVSKHFFTSRCNLTSNFPNTDKEFLKFSHILHLFEYILSINII